MWKRNAIYLLSRRLVENGIKPDEITTLFDWRPGRVWYFVEGVFNESEFALKAAEKASNGGPNYDDTRWFRDTEELLHIDGKTYAFSSQWGGESWHRAMNLLREKYPQFNIEFTPAQT
jgi:hypothetical protein